MTDLEFARRVLRCLQSGEPGASDLLVRCRQDVLRLEAAEEELRDPPTKQDEKRYWNTRINHLEGLVKLVNANIERLDRSIEFLRQREHAAALPLPPQVTKDIGELFMLCSKLAGCVNALTVRVDNLESAGYRRATCEAEQREREGGYSIRGRLPNRF